MIGKVLFAGRHDWANFAHRIARALRSLGVDARVYVHKPHPYGYVEDTWTPDELDAWLDGGIDWLLGTGDGAYDVLNVFAAEYEHNNLGMLHVGSAYRGNAVEFNARDREMGVRVQFVGVDSLRFTDGMLPAYPMWIAPEQWKAPSTLGPERRGILHCPSNRGSKGTDQIIDGARKAGVALTLLEGVSPEQAIAEMGRSAIYIDEINSSVGGYGCAAFEAAAMGCAVISDGRHWPTSRPWTPPFIQVRDADDLADVLRPLSGCVTGDPTDAESYALWWHGKHANSHYNWAVNHASQHAVARHWIAKLAEHAQ